MIIWSAERLVEHDPKVMSSRSVMTCFAILKEQFIGPYFF